jgi:hypothetical protein
MSIKNPKWTTLTLNPSLCSEMPEFNNLIYCMVTSDFIILSFVPLALLSDDTKYF